MELVLIYATHLLKRIQKYHPHLILKQIFSCSVAVELQLQLETVVWGYIKTLSALQVNFM